MGKVGNVSLGSGMNKSKSHGVESVLKVQGMKKLGWPENGVCV
jgi:hypothetical protein